MRRKTFAFMLLGLAVIAPLTEAQAQRRSSATGRGAVAGGLTGAAIGGIAGEAAVPRSAPPSVSASVR